MGETLKAGREIDALVAEKVMGCTVKLVDGYPYCGDGCTCAYPHAPSDRDSQLYGNLSCYSTDIVAAWAVLESFTPAQSDACNWTNAQVIHRTVDGHSFWEAEVAFWTAQADTAPLAICLAALKAKGVARSSVPTPQGGTHG